MKMNELEIIQHQQIEGLSLFLNTVDYRTPHLHSEWELIWVLENPLSVTCGQNHYLVEPGQMILFNPNEPHEFRKTMVSCTFACMQISPQIFPISTRLYVDAHFPNGYLSFEEMGVLKKQFLELMRVFLRQEEQYALFCVGQCCMMFHLLFSRMPNHELTAEQAAGMDKRNARVKRLIQFVDENYMYKIRLSDFAESEGCSMSYLSHFIKDTMNQTFQEYVASVRLGCACKLIAAGDKRMLDVCMESGFSDYRYFSKAFRKQYGMPPEGYSRCKAEQRGAMAVRRSSHSEERFYSKEESLMLLEKLIK